MEWISVKEKMPRKRTLVLFTAKNRTYFGSFSGKTERSEVIWTPDHGRNLYQGEVTHWMPLPDPPQV